MDDLGEAAAVMALFDHFSHGIATGHGADVAATLHLDAQLDIVTSESTILRGTGEVRAFLDRYASIATRYVWRWDRREVRVRGDVAWLVAVGEERTVTGDGEVKRAYRMTVVATREEGRWGLTQIHGSSPVEG
ncbi:MAG: nuclear transport factor 2 family protein [Polyangiales bacterium]